MKLFSIVFLGVILMSGSFLTADPVRNECPCKKCECTQEAHCGCWSNQGCSCNNNQSECLPNQGCPCRKAQQPITE